MKNADSVDAYIGSRVRLRRMTLGISQEQLGDALDLTFQQVQKYEKGQNRIGAGRLYKISQALTVPVEFFFQGLPLGDENGEGPGVMQRNADLQAFIASPEGHALALAFQQITDHSTRRRILDLISTIAADAVPVSG